MSCTPDHPPAARRPRRARLRQAARLLRRHLGPHQGRPTDSGISFLAAEGSPEQYVVRLRKADEKRLDLVSFGAATPADVDTLAEQLARRRRAAGLASPARSTPPAAATASASSTTTAAPSRSPPTSRSGSTARSRRGESIPVRLSHVVINSADPEAHRRLLRAPPRLRALRHPHAPAHGRDHVVHADQHLAPQHGDRPRPARLAAPRLFEMRGIDEYMRGTGRLLRAGVEKIWGPGRHMAGNNTFTLLPRPARQHRRVHDRAGDARRGHLAPAHLRLHRARGHRPVGHRQPDERVRRQGVVQRPRHAACSSPRRSDAVRAPGTRRSRRQRPRSRPEPRAYVVDAGRRACSPSPAATTVLDLVRAGGLPRRARGRRRGARRPGRPARPRCGCCRRCEPPTVRDFVAFEEHVEGVRQRGRRRRRRAGVVRGADVLLHQPARAGRRRTTTSPCRPARSCWTSSSRSPSSSAGTGRRLTPEQAREHIFGYTILNDWSARDLQRREMKVGLGPAKGKDFATTLGPWLVTADELEPYRDADGFLRAGHARSSVNGAEIGQDLLSNMGWPFEELVAYASRGTRVARRRRPRLRHLRQRRLPGRAVGPRGEPTPPPLQPGDVVDDDRRGHRHASPTASSRASTCRRCRRPRRGRGAGKRRH